METTHTNQELRFDASDFPQARQIEMGPGRRLFEDGDAFDGHAYLLLHGCVDVSIRAFDGGETMLYRLHPVSLLGELGFLGCSTRTATVTAAAPCRLLRISEDDWRQAGRQPEFSAKLRNSLYQRLVRSHQVVRRLGQGKVVHRLGVYLLAFPELAESDDGVAEVRLPTHAMLASMLNCRRERVTRLLKMLEKVGALEKLSGRGRVRIFRDSLIQALQNEC